MWISISHIAYVIFKTYVASDWTNGGVKQEQKPILQKAYLKVCVCALFLHLFKFQVLEKHKTWNEKRSRFFYIIVCIQNFKLLHCVSLAIFFMKKKTFRLRESKKKELCIIYFKKKSFIIHLTSTPHKNSLPDPVTFSLKKKKLNLTYHLFEDIWYLTWVGMSPWSKTG